MTVFFGGRNENGKICYHRDRFPNGIRCISDYAHSLGLKAGIYSDAGDNTCGFHYNKEGDNGYGVGLYGHEEQDLYQFLVEENFDFIKVDWCGGVRMALDEEEQYGKIGRIIDKIRHETGRTLVYNVCRWQFPGVEVTKVADSWRIACDIGPDFLAILHQLDNCKMLEQFTSPGHVNDLDMMQIGNGLTLEEEKTHFAMWCMMSTPLMIGCDLTKISEETLNILKNRELIAINQDEACIQAYVGKKINNQTGELVGEVWVKDLGMKDSVRKAVAFLNRSDEPIRMFASKQDILLDGDILSVRDVCNHKDLSVTDAWEEEISAHGVKVFVIEASAAKTRTDIVRAQIPSYKPVEKITMEKAKELIGKGALPVDARTKSEYEDWHLPEAISMPYTEVHWCAPRCVPDKNTPLIVYCATGKRSSQARTTLELLGYKEVYYLGGVDVSNYQ